VSTARPTAAEVFDLTGQVMWVTGSSRGIGAGVARHLADHGAAVVVHGRRPGSTDAVLAALPGASSVVADVRDPDSVAAAVGQIAERHGRLDGVVANVGGAAFGRLVDMDVARFVRQVELDLVSAFTTLRAAHRLLDAAAGAAVLVSATATLGASPSSPRTAPPGPASSMPGRWPPSGVRG
jgi:meso-butanediol dehydrogenase / (S,S)-butanediol dehydrogenase / diacetyl reductase